MVKRIRSSKNFTLKNFVQPWLEWHVKHVMHTLVYCISSLLSVIGPVLWFSWCDSVVVFFHFVYTVMWLSSMYVLYCNHYIHASHLMFPSCTLMILQIPNKMFFSFLHQHCCSVCCLCQHHYLRWSEIPATTELCIHLHEHTIHLLHRWRRKHHYWSQNQQPRKQLRRRKSSEETWSNGVFISLQIHQTDASFFCILPSLTTFGAKVSHLYASWVNSGPQWLYQCRVLWWENSKQKKVCGVCVMFHVFPMDHRGAFSPPRAPRLAGTDEPWNIDNFKYLPFFFFLFLGNRQPLM